MADMTLLQKATQRGDVAEMRRLVANGRNVNERDADGDTALHYAADYGHVEAMRVLVELGARRVRRRRPGRRGTQGRRCSARARSRERPAVPAAGPSCSG